MIDETHVAYTPLAAESDVERIGQGVMEHVWRATPDEIAARASRMGAVVKARRS